MADEVQGLRKLFRRMDRVADTTELENAMGRACSIVEAAAKQMAPKDTGALRNSIQSKVEINGEDIQGIVFSPLEYAPYIEYGTGLFAESSGRKDVPWNYQDDKGEWHSTNGQHPQPFMRPALEENRDEIKEILGESINND